MMLELPLCILRHDADALMMHERLLRARVMDIVLVNLVVLNCVLRHFVADRFGSEKGRIGRICFDRGPWGPAVAEALLVDTC